MLTAVPGLMRTGSYLKAKFKGDVRQEFVWFALVGNLPGFSVGAEYAARCIRRALENGRQVCTISLPAKLLIACEALMPDTTEAFSQAQIVYYCPEEMASNCGAASTHWPIVSCLYVSWKARGARFE